MPRRKKQRISEHSSSSRRSLRSGRASTLPLARTPRAQRLPLPADLIYDIAAKVVGDYFADIILTPDDATSKDTILSLLHASRICREFTFKFLNYLWGDAFINHSKRTLSDFRPMIRLLREWSMFAHHPPAAPPNYLGLAEVEPEPEFMKMRCVRHPIFPILRIAAFFLESAKHAVRWKNGRDTTLRVQPFFELESVGPLREVYHAIPSHLRAPLLGRVWDKLIERAIVWSSIHPMIRNISALSTLLVRLVRWPPLNQASLNQTNLRLQEALRRQLEQAQKSKADADTKLAAFLEIERPEIMPMVTIEEVSSRAFTRVVTDLQHRALDGSFEINRLGRQCLAVFLSPGEERTRFENSMGVRFLR
ncbi:hypothetical protein DENSPDRAFT_844280 [Dentipellis sp. KUC8613]|nr:hypothetical protein DENSPDRAFT_844280 [Dentipellis sp. KUC8613]